MGQIALMIHQHETDAGCIVDGLVCATVPKTGRKSDDKQFFPIGGICGSQLRLSLVRYAGSVDFWEWFGVSAGEYHLNQKELKSPQLR